jgi:hypothetical protein
MGSILGSLLFLIYNNDLPLVLNRIYSPVLFADDTSVIICNPDPLVFLHSVTEVFNKLKLWFNANLLFLNLSKTELKLMSSHFYLSLVLHAMQSELSNHFSIRKPC